ncbi:MAG: carboxynorspermidine decarboxylase [Agathobacter sp.]|nr:carboxynorspermidine decarboxylase [Agathobacter sp.]
MQLCEVLTPSYVLDEKKLINNLKILKRVEDEAGCKILLAQKAFSMFYAYPIIAKYISGTTASGLYEARLGKEEMGKENHVFAPAFKEDEIDELADICDHVIFNSFSQLKKYKDRCVGRTSIGIRINPECSTQGENPIYDPCAKGSRLGVTLNAFEKGIREEGIEDVIEGIHFHTLCEQNSDDLETTLKAVEEKFGKYLHKVKWINMGGGHHITRDDYDVERLIRLIKNIKEKYNVEVYLEPGEAIALNAGYLITEVMDVVDNDIKTLILDASAACHMPDVLEMPYRPPLRDSGEAGELRYTYRLSSCTCLAGDIIGDYSFDREIKPGDRLCFEDMAIYSMVKNNTFNGMALPSIYTMKEDGSLMLVRKFGYDDFKMRLS